MGVNFSNAAWCLRAPKTAHSNEGCSVTEQSDNDCTNGSLSLKGCNSVRQSVPGDRINVSSASERLYVRRDPPENTKKREAFVSTAEKKKENGAYSTNFREIRKKLNCGDLDFRYGQYSPSKMEEMIHSMLKKRKQASELSKKSTRGDLPSHSKKEFYWLIPSSKTNEQFRSAYSKWMQWRVTPVRVITPKSSRSISNSSDITNSLNSLKIECQLRHKVAIAHRNIVENQFALPGSVPESMPSIECRGKPVLRINPDQCMRAWMQRNVIENKLDIVENKK